MSRSKGLQNIGLEVFSNGPKNIEKSNSPIIVKELVWQGFGILMLTGVSQLCGLLPLGTFPI